MAIEIRRMLPDDLGQVIVLLREFAEYEKLSEYCTATAERLQRGLFAEGSPASGLVAAEEDRLIGYAIFCPNFSSFRGETGLYLEDIYVTTQMRGMGVGKLLLGEVARIAREGGFERIDFQVLDWNTPAIDFYRRLGAVSNDEATHFKFSGAAFDRLAI